MTLHACKRGSVFPQIFKSRVFLVTFSMRFVEERERNRERKANVALQKFQSVLLEEADFPAFLILNFCIQSVGPD